MNDGKTVWLPYRPERVPRLPDGLSYRYWDGTASLPGDPREVRFLAGPPAPGAERVFAHLLPRAVNVEVVQLLSSGYDHMMPLLDLLPPGARLATARGVHREATAELAVSLLLALGRGLDHYARRQAAGEWRPNTGTTLVGKRVVVVGYGAVGAAVAARHGVFGCEVVLVARTGRTTPAGRVHGAAELPALLPTADAVVLCAPLTEATRGMFGAAEPARLKDGAFLVNVARGELLDTAAAVREVRGGRLRVVLDVTDPEPLPAGHPLWDLPGALVTPHVAAFTDAFPQMSVDFLRRQPHRFARGAELDNVVHTAAYGHEYAYEHEAGERVAQAGDDRRAGRLPGDRRTARRSGAGAWFLRAGRVLRRVGGVGVVHLRVELVRTARRGRPLGSVRRRSARARDRGRVLGVGAVSAAAGGEG
ncbi:NAD(P)-dependent oxidoreductase [Streptomyces sp. NPDC021356]|uniref:NAD(P)-dependent oxidoreductase n=1 Tax=Streptomyces sp. NPDC021356 TaxID=3154900 RepID=UPI0033C9F8F2